jgi:hypothetical protein
MDRFEMITGEGVDQDKGLFFSDPPVQRLR